MIGVTLMVLLVVGCTVGLIAMYIKDEGSVGWGLLKFGVWVVAMIIVALVIGGIRWLIDQGI